MIVAGAMTFAVMGFRQILAPPPRRLDVADDATQVRGGRYSCQGCAAAGAGGTAGGVR